MDPTKFPMFFLWPVFGGWWRGGTRGRAVPFFALEPSPTGGGFSGQLTPGDLPGGRTPTSQGAVQPLHPENPRDRPYIGTEGNGPLSQQPEPAAEQLGAGPSAFPPDRGACRILGPIPGRPERDPSNALTAAGTSPVAV